jgi:hypothetical protein
MLFKMRLALSGGVSRFLLTRLTALQLIPTAIVSLVEAEF